MTALQEGHRMGATALSGGFEAPVFDAQMVFRSIMDAFARPGTAVALDAKTEPPGPLSAEAGAVALALLDHETPVWCDSVLAGAPRVLDWLKFHTGAPVTEAPEDAAFAFIGQPDRMPALAAFAQGTAEYPDRSTTLVVMATRLGTDRSAGGAELSGPGIRTATRFAPDPLPPGFWDQARANHAQFPRGVDMVFAAPGRIAALPRSTRIGEEA